MTTNKPDDREPLDKSSVQGRPATNEEVAYRDGYVRGRSTEQYRAAQDRAVLDERRRAAARADDSTSAILLIALFIVALAGIGGLIFYFGSRPQEAPEVESPDINIEVPEAPPPPENNPIELPDIDVNVPNPVSPDNSSDESTAPQNGSDTSAPAEPPPEPESEPSQ